MPSVSIVLPVYNGAETILRACESILSQTFQDLELLVVDDGSIDATREKLQTLTDNRLRIIESDHQGVAGAFNLGLRKTAGHWIGRMDADDFSYPDRIEKQVEFLKTNSYDAVGCQVRIVDDSGSTPESLLRYQNWINEETLDSAAIHALRFVELPIVNPTLLACREFFGDGYVKSELPEDYDLFLNAVSRGMKIGKVPERLFDWHDHADRVTRNHDRYSDSAFEACRWRHLVTGPLADSKRVDVWGAGKTGKRWLTKFIGHGIEVRRCIEVSERKIGQSIHGVQVVAPSDIQQRKEGEIRDVPMVVAVGSEGSRPLIRDFLKKRGYRMGNDTWFVA